MSSKKPTGLFKLDEGTIEHDFALLERFQDFSAELLRISLLGLSAIGFGVSKLVFPETGQSATQISPSAKCFLAVALVSFAISAAAALQHRYSSSDSMSSHLKAMRLYLQKPPDDPGTPQQNKKPANESDSASVERDEDFKLSSLSLAISSVFIAVGAFSFAVAVILSI